MDEAVLPISLWVTEPQPHRADTIEHLGRRAGAVPRLARRPLGVRGRLKQERIGWDVA